MVIRHYTMASMAAAGGPLAWVVDFVGGYALQLRSQTEKLQVHAVTLTATAVVALIALVTWWVLRGRARPSEGWRVVALSSLILNSVFVLTIAAMAVVRLAAIE